MAELPIIPEVLEAPDGNVAGDVGVPNDATVINIDPNKVQKLKVLGSPHDHSVLESDHPSCDGGPLTLETSVCEGHYDCTCDNCGDPEDLENPGLFKHILRVGNGILNILGFDSLGETDQKKMARFYERHGENVYQNRAVMQPLLGKATSGIGAGSSAGWKIVTNNGTVLPASAMKNAYNPTEAPIPAGSLVLAGCDHNGNWWVIPIGSGERIEVVTSALCNESTGDLDSETKYVWVNKVED